MSGPRILTITPTLGTSPWLAETVASVAALGDPAAPRAIYGGVKLIDKNGRRLGAIPISPMPALNRLLYAQWIEPVYQHGTLVTRAAVERGGGYDESFRYCGDSEFLGRACLAGVEFVRATGRPVAAFRLRAGQLTKHLEAMQAEHRRMEQKIPLRAARRGPKHWAARLAFRAVNVPVYLERIARFGFIGFGEVLARGE